MSPRVLFRCLMIVLLWAQMFRILNDESEDQHRKIAILLLAVVITCVFLKPDVERLIRGHDFQRWQDPEKTERERMRTGMLLWMGAIVGIIILLFKLSDEY